MIFDEPSSSLKLDVNIVEVRSETTSIFYYDQYHVSSVVMREPNDVALDMAETVCPGATDWQEVLNCFQGFPACFNVTNTTGPETAICPDDAPHYECTLSIVDCIQELLPDETNIFGNTTDLLQDTFRDLQPCTLTEGIALAQCFLENADTCKDSCTASAWAPVWSLPRGLPTCEWFSDIALAPMCGLVSCCSPCVPVLESLAACTKENIPIIKSLPCDATCNVTSGEVNDPETGNGDEVDFRDVVVEIFEQCLRIHDSTGLMKWFDLVDCAFRDVFAAMGDDLMPGEDQDNNNTTDAMNLTAAPTMTPTTIPPENATSTQAPTDSNATETVTSMPTMSPINVTVTDTPTTSPVNVTETASPTSSAANATEETEAPTASPSNSTKMEDAPTTAPSSSAPSVTTTLEPGMSQQNYDFTGLTIRLEGGAPFTSESRRAFEEATEEFYRETFGNANGTRRLQGSTSGFSSFNTDVEATGEAPDARGNTITYNQTISFESSDGDSLDRESAEKLILRPFSDPEQVQEYIETLQEKDSDFLSVQAVESNPKNSRENDDTDKGPWLLIGIITGGALVCICCFAFVAVVYATSANRSGKNKDLEGPGSEEFHDEIGGYGAPEAPVPVLGDDDKFGDFEGLERDSGHNDYGGFGGMERESGRNEYDGFGDEGGGFDDNVFGDAAGFDDRDKRNRDGYSDDGSGSESGSNGSGSDGSYGSDGSSSDDSDSDDVSDRTPSDSWGLA